MLKTKLYPFQKEGLHFHIARPYSLNLCEMGLGKSLQALATVVHSGMSALVVCPAFLKRNWKEEVKKHTYLQPFILGSQGHAIDKKANVYITNYEQVKKWKGFILKSNIDFFIADEVHYLKNPNAKRTAEFFDMIARHRPARFIGLTGTPIQNRVPDFYVPLKICDLGYQAPKKLLSRFNYYSFAETFSHRRNIELANGITVKKYYGIKQIDRLREIVKPRVFRKTTDQAIELPQIVYDYVHLDKFNRTLAEKLKASYEVFKDNEESMGAELMKIKMEAALEKAPFTARYALDLLEQDIKPLVIFSDHVESTENISEYLRSKGYRVPFITGAMPTEKRADLVNLFQDGKLDGICGTIGSCSTGINLTKANHTIFNDISWVPAYYEQAKKRVHRMGQKNKCFIHNIVAGPFDEMISKMINDKQKTINRVLTLVK